MKTEDELQEEIRYLKQRYKDGAFTENIDKKEYGVDICCMIRVLRWVLA